MVQQRPTVTTAHQTHCFTLLDHVADVKTEPRMAQVPRAMLANFV